MKKRILSFLLAATIVISSITPVVVNASTKRETMLTNTTIVKNAEEKKSSSEEQVSEKTNYIFIETSDISNIQYSYEQDGKTFLVKECINNDLSEINTEIYEVDGLSNVLVNKYNTTIEKNNDVLIVTTNDDSVVTKDVIDINGDSLDINRATTFSRNPVSGTYTGGLQYDYINNKYFTLWFNTGSDSGSNKISNYSLSVIISILSGVSGNPYVVAGVTQIAQLIVAEAIPIVYWNKSYQDLWEVTYPGKQYIGWAVGVRTYTDFYEDSARRYKIGSDFYEYHDPTYWPSFLN